MAVKEREIQGEAQAQQGQAQQSRRVQYAPPHETGVVEAEQIAGGAIFIVWVLGALLLAGSVFGTYVPFAGGWETFRTAMWPPNWTAVGIALAIQGPLTWAQWSFKARAVLWWRARTRFGVAAAQPCLGWWGAYGVALAISAAFNIATYTAWLVPAFSPAIGATVAWWIVVGGAILGDVLPEWIFVRD